MNIEMASLLRELRRKKGVTQEELANRLCITAQSVGKWERGEGYPDITLLPSIALYFGVTTDELLGVDRAKIDEALAKYNDESNRLRHLGEVEKVIELWEEAHRHFPCEDEVKYHLMYALYMRISINSDQLEEYSKRIIELGEYLLENSTDINRHNGAAQVLCLLSNQLGDSKSALKYANLVGSYYTTRDELLANVLSGEDAVRHCQTNICTLTDMLVGNAQKMVYSAKYTPRDRIRVYEYCISLYKLLFSDGDFGFYATRLADCYRELARAYAALDDEDGCVSALSDMTKYAVMYDTQSDFHHTSLMVDRLENKVESSVKNTSANSCKTALSALGDSCYDFIRGRAEFIKLKSELEQYAN